jgi:hypothetical protein
MCEHECVGRSDCSPFSGGGEGMNFEVGERGRPRVVWKAGLLDATADDLDLRSDRWEHLAVVRDLEQRTVTFYRNGVVAQVVKTALAPPPVSPHLPSRPVGVWRIGGDHRGGGGSGSRFKGFMSELRLWSASRSAAEVARYCHVRALGTEPNLIACYPLNELCDVGGPVPSVFYDLGPYRNHGLLDKFDSFSAARHHQACRDIVRLRQEGPRRSSSEALSVARNTWVPPALVVPSSLGKWLHVSNPLAAPLNSYTLSYAFRLTRALPVDTVCLLFHPDSQPDVLSTSLLLDHHGRLMVGEHLLPAVGPGLGSGVWHHIAVTMHLTPHTEHNTYRVYVDGREVAALTHSGMLDLSMDYVATLRDAFCLGIVTPRPADALAGRAPMLAAWSTFLTPSAPTRLPDVQIRDVVLHQGAAAALDVPAPEEVAAPNPYALAAPAAAAAIAADAPMVGLAAGAAGAAAAVAVGQGMPPRALALRCARASRCFDFVDDALPLDVQLVGDQVEPVQMEGGLFIMPACYLLIQHRLGQGQGEGERLNCFSLVADVLLEQAPARHMAVFASDGARSRALAGVHANMSWSEPEAVSVGAPAPALKVAPLQFQRLCVTRDLLGALHFYINGAWSHSRHNGDGVDVPRSSLDPMGSICVFASSNSEHMVGGILRWIAVYNYTLTADEVQALGASPF